MNLPLYTQIESLLFYKTEPVSYVWLAKTFGVPESDIRQAVGDLRTGLVDRGITLVEHDDRIMLATHPSMGSFLEQLHKKDMHAELSRPAIETLTIILYKEGVTKADLDYIRGVNSQFMLRNLLIRGLIEKKENPDDKRRSLYIPSHDTLRYLGITSHKELPDQELLLEKIETLLNDRAVGESSDRDDEAELDELQESLETL